MAARVAERDDQDAWASVAEVGSRPNCGANGNYRPTGDIPRKQLTSVKQRFGVNTPSGFRSAPGIARRPARWRPA